MITSRQIAEFLNLKLEGSEIAISGFSQLSSPHAGTILFAKKFVPEYAQIISNRKDIFAIVTVDYKDILHCPHVISSNPRLDFIRVLNHFFPTNVGNGMIHPSAVIENGAAIGKNVTIGAHCFISSQCIIGDNTIIHPNVTIENEVFIGRDCEIKSGAVIGQDGFGFERYEDGTPIHFPHYGKVIVKDNVFIGANACIDRGAMGDTVVEDDVKIANLVHIAHNCHIGNGSFIIASSVLCGGAQVGNNCWIAPNVSVKEHIRINDNALIGLGSVVLNDVEQDSVMVGNPARKL